VSTSYRSVVLLNAPGGVAVSVHFRHAPVSPAGPASHRSWLDVVRGLVLMTALPQRQQWRVVYARVALVGDLVVLLAALTLAQFLRFGLSDAPEATTVVEVDYTILSAEIAVVWFLALRIYRTRASRLFGHGTEEYRRVVRASFTVFAFVAMVSLMVQAVASRGYLAVAFPLGTLGLLAWRYFLRLTLHRRRAKGQGMARAMVVGSPESAAKLGGWLKDNPTSGHELVAVWTPRDDGDQPATQVQGLEVPVIGASQELGAALKTTGAEAVIVTDTEGLGQDGIRELTWELDKREVELLVSPNVIDVAPSRLYLHDVSGMPLLHLSQPQYASATRFAKSSFDRLGALCLILLLAPVLLAAAAGVKLTSRGPVLYRQERIGKDGNPFGMIKFRSMRVGADAALEAMLAAQGKALSQLPKVTDDPRITTAGAFMRRYSIDELPQLFNVLKGDMSLVGPRPQRYFEVEQYDHVAHRRLTVRPGMTGLWQISGRSNVEYDHAIRLDVHYVENWSMTSDLAILWKTARAVLARDGAC